jgi:diguanylate cyclase (GGDEF)-like protein/putative nucleotidyltransferase with HDIG domain
MNRILNFERKLIGTLLLAATIPILMQYLVSFSIIEMQFDNVRNERYALVHNNLGKSIENLKRQQLLINIDYAHWSDFYVSTIKDDDVWFENIFDNITSNRVGIEMIYVINNNGEAVYEYHPEDRFLQDYAGFVSNAKAGNDLSTIISFNENLYIVSFACIEDTENTMALGGVLVMGQPITSKIVSDFPKAHGFDVDIINNGNGIKSGNSTNRFDELLNMKEQQLEMQDDIRYYKLDDYNKNTIALLEIKETGDFIKEAVAKTQNSFYLTLGIALLIVFIFVVFLKNSIMHPIRELRNKVRQMRAGSYGSSNEKDEIIALTEEFEAMSLEIGSHTAEIEEQNQTLQYLVYKDDITGAYNKRFFRLKFEEEFNANAKENKSFCLALIDLDYFKVYRELVSIKTRNEVLCRIHNIIAQDFDKSCYVCFDGTDEFRIILTDTQYKDAIDAISKISSDISKENFASMEQLPTGHITVSCGVANYPKDADNDEKLYYAAVDRLHRAKHHNQGNVGYFYSIFSDIKEEIHADRKSLIYATKAFLAVIDAMDEYTYTHTEGVVKYASIIADELKLDENDKENISIGALLHDIGKLELGRELLNKKEKLSKEEIELIKQHPVFGVNMLKTLRHFEEIADIVKYHHERYDGMGYPEGLSGEAIPLGARIVAVADSFDAMTTTRAYRNLSKSFAEAADELTKCAGAQFDPQIVKIFVDYIKNNNYNINIL